MSDEQDRSGADPTATKLMSIGMFSRATLLTVKALRNYHESGLLVPAEVDPATGYRAYDPGQLADAAAIWKLRQLDVSLDDIAAIMASRDPDLTAKILEQHLADMQRRLEATQRIVDGLLLGNERPSTLTPPHIVAAEHTHVASFRGTIDRNHYPDFLGHAYDTLFTTLGHAGIAASGPAGACYPAEANEVEEVRAFVPVAEPFAPPAASGIVVDELPARTVASATHHGPYEEIGDAYRSLGRWVASHATSLVDPVREHYIISYEQTSDASEFVTEIHWPIEQEASAP